MDFEMPAEVLDFRQQVRDFIASHRTPELDAEIAEHHIHGYGPASSEFRGRGSSSTSRATWHRAAQRRPRLAPARRRPTPPARTGERRRRGRRRRTPCRPGPGRSTGAPRSRCRSQTLTTKMMTAEKKIVNISVRNPFHPVAPASRDRSTSATVITANTTSATYSPKSWPSCREWASASTSEAASTNSRRSASPSTLSYASRMPERAES